MIYGQNIIQTSQSQSFATACLWYKFLTLKDSEFFGGNILENQRFTLSLLCGVYLTCLSLKKLPTTVDMIWRIKK